MGDLPIPMLNNKTPLEVARKPCIDKLARAGEQLLVRTVPVGYPPGSDVANMSLLGYEPERYYSGRAPLEAASMGIELAADEIAFRCNLVTLVDEPDGKKTMLDFSAGHISTQEATQLIKAIEEECGTKRLRFYPGISYRHLMVHKGLPPSIKTVPPHDFMDQDITEFYLRYNEVDYFKTLFEKSSEVLKNHPVNKQRLKENKKPANSIWLWGSGPRVNMETINERFGISGGVISAVDLLKGLGYLSGLDVIHVEGATGYLDTNYAGKASAALDALHDHDFILVHVEAPDEAGHQGLVAEKIQAIEDFDAKIVGPVFEEMEKRGEEYRLVITMDHYTPISRKTHVDWPVPMVLYDSRGVTLPSNRSYSESNAKAAVEENGLMLVSGLEFFSRFIERKSRK